MVGNNENPQVFVMIIEKVISIDYTINYILMSLVAYCITDNNIMNAIDIILKYDVDPLGNVSYFKNSDGERYSPLLWWIGKKPKTLCNEFIIWRYVYWRMMDKLYATS
jgi:hypothetical protein